VTASIIGKVHITYLFSHHHLGMFEQCRCLEVLTLQLQQLCMLLLQGFDVLQGLISRARCFAAVAGAQLHQQLQQILPCL
jgi:hypothetical protein